MFFFNKSSCVNLEEISLDEAYLKILNENLDEAHRIFLKFDSPRALWGISLVQILDGYIDKYPSYFQIRNFLEIDLDFLLKNNKIDYVEQLLGALDLLQGINQEIYKYVARVFFENKCFELTKKYLDKSKDIFYNDPELHFMYAKYYINESDFYNANFYLTECLSVVPDYVPAINLKNEIAKYLA